MYQDLYQYLQWLQMCIQAQEKRIASLEATLLELQNQLKQIQEKATIHVDTIEYKFDQLKVEALEGTLNIGLNPNDLSGIEDFAVQNQSLNTPFPPKQQMRLSMKIEESIQEYLQSDLPLIIEETQRNLSIPPNESYLSFIKKDIIQQLPSRIEYHLKANAKSIQSAEDDEQIVQQVIDAIKQEIHNGVQVFLNNLPENLKGMNTDEL